MYMQYTRQAKEGIHRAEHKMSRCPILHPALKSFQGTITEAVAGMQAWHKVAFLMQACIQHL